MTAHRYRVLPVATAGDRRLLGSFDASGQAIFHKCADDLWTEVTNDVAPRNFTDLLSSVAVLVHVSHQFRSMVHVRVCPNVSPSIWPVILLKPSEPIANRKAVGGCHEIK